MFGRQRKRLGRRLGRRSWTSERGEVASWLILAAGLAAAAVAASAAMQFTIGSLTDNVAAAAEGEAGASGAGGGGADPGGPSNPGDPADLGGGDPTTPSDDPSRRVIAGGETVPDSTGPPILREPQTDDDDTDNWFWPGDHSYSHTSPPTAADYGTLIEAINERGVHPNQTEPFTPGETYVGDVDIPGPFGVDNVNTTAIYDANGNQVGVRNETMENHALHPGWVERTVVRDSDGNLRIQTSGGGTGALGGPNIWFDESVWGDVDSIVLDDLP